MVRVRVRSTASPAGPRPRRRWEASCPRENGGLYGGLRAAETTNLRRSNFVPSAGLMGFIGKGSKQRSVALPERARAVVRQYLAATVGQRLTPHKLRHACGKNCVDLGAD